MRVGSSASLAKGSDASDTKVATGKQPCTGTTEGGVQNMDSTLDGTRSAEGKGDHHHDAVFAHVASRDSDIDERRRRRKCGNRILRWNSGLEEHSSEALT